MRRVFLVKSMPTSAHTHSSQLKLRNLFCLLLFFSQLSFRILMLSCGRLRLNESTILLVYEQHRGITRHLVPCRWSADTVPLILCRCSAQIVRNDGSTPRPPRGCLSPEIHSPAGGNRSAAAEARYVHGYVRSALLYKRSVRYTSKCCHH